MRFQDKVVVITGAAGGIGLAAVRRFASEGARIVAVDLQGSDLDSALLRQSLLELMRFRTQRIAVRPKRYRGTLTGA